MGDTAVLDDAIDTPGKALPARQPRSLSALGFLDERLRLGSETDRHTENQRRDTERKPIGHTPKENIEH